jgi:hypothetical protein
VTHPCQDHMATCDHCYQCDILGVCCAHGHVDDVAELMLAMQCDADLGFELLRAAEADRIRVRLGRVTAPELSPLTQAAARDAVRIQQPTPPLALPSTTQNVPDLIQEVSRVHR